MGIMYPSIWVCPYCDRLNSHTIRSCRLTCSRCFQRSVFHSIQCAACAHRVECFTLPPALPYECANGYKAGCWDECMEKLNEAVRQDSGDGGVH